MEKLSISQSYMRRESERWNRSVEGWVSDYCKRNKIPTEIIPDIYDDSPRLELTFRTKNQLRWFGLKGNKEFPYFEFL